MVDEEFPDDPALQQVHIARKIIAREAEHEGLSFLEYIKLLRKRERRRGQSYIFHLTTQEINGVRQRKYGI